VQELFERGQIEDLVADRLRAIDDVLVKPENQPALSLEPPKSVEGWRYTFLVTLVAFPFCTFISLGPGPELIWVGCCSMLRFQRGNRRTAE
jgi:hypothetical protein